MHIQKSLYLVAGQPMFCSKVYDGGYPLFLAHFAELFWKFRYSLTYLFHTLLFIHACDKCA